MNPLELNKRLDNAIDTLKEYLPDSSAATTALIELIKASAHFGACTVKEKLGPEIDELKTLLDLQGSISTIWKHL
jgi:hypothetical protein